MFNHPPFSVQLHIAYLTLEIARRWVISSSLGNSDTSLNGVHQSDQFYLNYLYQKDSITESTPGIEKIHFCENTFGRINLLPTYPIIRNITIRKLSRHKRHVYASKSRLESAIKVSFGLILS